MATIPSPTITMRFRACVVCVEASPDIVMFVASVVTIYNVSPFRDQEEKSGWLSKSSDFSLLCESSSSVWRGTKAMHPSVNTPPHPSAIPRISMISSSSRLTTLRTSAPHRILSTLPTSNISIRFRGRPRRIDRHKKYSMCSWDFLVTAWSCSESKPQYVTSSLSLIAHALINVQSTLCTPTSMVVWPIGVQR